MLFTAGVPAMPSAREMVEAAQKEGEFQQQLLDLARTLGWRCYHTWDSRHSEGGFPDIIAIRGPTLLALEIKGAKARPPPPEQVGWIGAFKQVRFVSADFVYPKDFPEVKDALEKAVR